MSSTKSKRMAFRSCQTQQQGLSTPATPAPLLEPTNLSISSMTMGVNGINNEGLLNLIHFANVLQIFKKSVDRFKGTNVPVTYKSSYEFSQKWQQANKVKFQSNDVVYLAANSFCLTIAVFVLLHKIPLIWYMSVYQVFGFQKLVQWWVISLIMIIVDVFLKIYLIRVEMVKVTQKSEAYKKQFKFNLISMFSLDLITILVILSQLIFHSESSFNIIIDFLVIFIQTKRFNQIYNSLTIILIGNKYKNYVNLFGFISKLFTALHIFTILVYAVTLLSPNLNWLENIGKQNEDAVTRYIYSLYFTGTTMFTVGYGDIIPKTNVEIIVILFIQAVGIILIGYIVSQIGHTLSVMRQARQDFENDIQNADTICHHYNLDDGLKNRVRNYIVNHRLANEQLNTNEQNNILMKLNEELRNQVKYVNHLNIIKTSLFFICHWSKKMQNDLSKKLQKFIFSPNQPITRQDKLYIVTRGNIDVYTERKVGNKLYCKKHLKSIERKPNGEVHSNVYGYTTLFTGKCNKLTAISKDFAICYALEYSDILQSMKDDDRDFQCYHQIKSKLQLQKFPQSYEIPRLINNRQHYCPTKAIILRRYKRECSQIQERSYKFRQYVKRKFIYFQQKDEYEESDSEVIASQQDYMSDNFNKLEQNQKLGQVSLQRMLQQNKKNALKSFISFRSYRRRFYSKIEDEKMKYDEVKRLIQNQVITTSLFEVSKNYLKYYKKSNCNEVLIQLNKNTIKDFNQINSKNMTLDWINLLVFKSKVQTSIKSSLTNNKFF